jgi:hypothetical protein
VRRPVRRRAAPAADGLVGTAADAGPRPVAQKRQKELFAEWHRRGGSAGTELEDDELKQRLLEMKVFHAPQGTPAVTIEWFRRILARAELPPDVQVRTPPSLRR